MIRSEWRNRSRAYTLRMDPPLKDGQVALGDSSLPEREQKILVVRVGRAGDLVMITPALNAILEVFPDAHIHLMTSQEGRRVMRGYHPRVSETWLYHRRFPARLWLWWNLLRKLKDERYSKVYVFESDTRYHKMLRPLGSTLFHLEDDAQVLHYSERCFQLVNRSTSQTPGRSWVTLPVSDEGSAKARALLMKHGVEPGTTIVGFHHTFSGSRRNSGDRRGMRHRVWPRRSFLALAQQLHAKAAALNLPLRIVIDVLPEEVDLVEPLVAESDGAITLLAEAPDFERYKGLLRCLDVLVTPNTGPMHIAAAVGTPVVALFSRWSIDECGPYIPQARFRALRAEGDDAERRGLIAISPAAVAEAALELIAAGRGA